MLQLGILGSGAVLKWHFFGIDDNRDVTVGAVASRNETTGKAASDRYGAAYYKSAAEMFDHERNLDGIINLMPNHLHYETCNAAIDAGIRFILCEKPLGNDINQTIKLVEKVEKTGTQLQVGYMKRFNPGFIKVKEALEILGEVHFVNFTMVESGAANRVSHRDASSLWKTDARLSGGGNLTHVGSHLIDLARYFFGDISEVSCKMKKDNLDGPEYHANARIVFENGTDADIRIGRSDIPNLGADWEMFQGGWNEYVEVIGENGYIRAANPSWEGLGPIRVTSWFKGEPGPRSIYYASNLQWVNEIAAFVDGIRAGKLVSQATTARDAYKVDFAVNRMRKSDKEGGVSVSVQ